MIAAIYARKSTEQNGVGDEAKSVTRQLELARVYAERKGWTVEDAHIYIDDAISGAEYLKRPAYLRMMAALEPAPPFGALIVMEQSRLGRDTGRVLLAIQALEDAGVEIWSYHGNRISMEDESGEVNATVMGLVDRMHRRQSSTRGREVGRAKASRGHVAGGTVYGYRNLRVGGHVERQIVPEQAAIVERIFAEIAVGRGFARIAQDLNRDGIPAPRHRWAMTGVREMVFRPLYRGRLVYGKTHWQHRKGTKVKVDVPESEWVTLEAPALRIVSEEQWQAAHARLERTRQTYLRQTGGQLYGRPEAGIEARYLLSGFLVCGECGGAMHAIKRTSQRGAPRVYFICNGWRVNGSCDNAMSAPLPDVVAAVLEAFRRDVLTPELVEAVVTRAIELHRSEPDMAEERRRRLTSEAGRLQAELTRYAEAVALPDGALASIVEAAKTRQRRLAEVQAQLEHLDGLTRAAGRWDDGGLRDEVRSRLTDWHGLIGRQPAIARQILRKLLDGKLVMTPRVTDEGRCYEITGQASYGALLAGVVGLVPPG